MVVNFQISFTPSQEEILEAVDTHKYTVVSMSRQAGKSVLAKALVCKWLFEPNRIISYITPSLLLGKKFFKDLTAILPSSLLVSCNGSDLVIESITGSRLYFFSAEQANRLRGMTNHYIILDELAFMKNGRDFYYSVVAPTFKNHGQKMLFISTPCGFNNLFYELAVKAQSGVKDWIFIKKTVYDDSFVQDVEALRASTPELAWRQEYLVEVIEGAGSFFTGYHNCYIEDGVFDYKGKLHFGIDFSSVGKDETIVTFINNSGQIVQHLIKGQLNDKYKQIADLIIKYDAYGYAESNSIGSVMINEIKKLLGNKQNHIKEWITSNQSKTEIITELAVALENEQISYSDKELDKQLSAFGYSVTKTNKLAFEGVGEKDDRVMSLAMALKAKKDIVGYSASNFAFAGR